MENDVEKFLESLKKGDLVFYGGVSSQITAVHEDGTLDIQELVSGVKDKDGNELPPRWFHRIDPKGLEFPGPSTPIDATPTDATPTDITIPVDGVMTSSAPTFDVPSQENATASSNPDAGAEE